MTLRDLMENINVQGNIKVQCYEDDEYSPIIYYEDDMDCAIPCELGKYLDREIEYMFPYLLWSNGVDVCGICIELKPE